MGEYRLEVSETPSEERTEPFSQTEYEARVKRAIQVEAMDSPGSSPVPLDSLRVEDHHHQSGIRILVRPLTRSRSVSPGSDNCQWLALRAEVAEQEQPQHQVLAVTQTSKDIKFSVRIPGGTLDDDSPRPPIWCELYYDPASDDQILLNKSETPITLKRVSRPTPTSPSVNFVINPGTTKALFPGTWRLQVGESPVLDFRILEKKPATLKRSFEADNEQFPGKKPKPTANNAEGNAGDGVIMFLRPQAEPLVFPLPTANNCNAVMASNCNAVTAASEQPLLEVQQDETVLIPGGCEIDEYHLTKRKEIASTSLSSVYTAEHSNVPDGVVTVKVLKTRSKNHVRPQDIERNVIRQADMWLRECQSQEDLEHESIVKLYGGDARYLSLYMEHVEAKDLSTRGVWRHQSSDQFLGSRSDATRILYDIASALNYLHEKHKIHNDIKPANILYSSERGAVLCDFGLSTDSKHPASSGGTPYYVPPEFIGTKLRGPASDVWALGITMLYVLGKIPFPDARARQAHPKRLYWYIAELNRPGMASQAYGTGSRGQGLSAVAQMRVWLEEIAEVKEKLNDRDKLERLVADMLIPNPHQRITMARVLQELAKR